MRNRHHTHVQSIINICSTRPHQVFHTTKYFSSIFLLYPHFHKLQNWTQKVRLTVIFQISGGGTKFVIRSVGGHDGELWMLDDWIKIPVGSPVQLSSAKVKKGDLNRGGGARSRDVIAPGVESLPPPRLREVAARDTAFLMFIAGLRGRRQGEGIRSVLIEFTRLAGLRLSRSKVGQNYTKLVTWQKKLSRKYCNKIQTFRAKKLQYIFRQFCWIVCSEQC